jgi:hypothetical protein
MSVGGSLQEQTRCASTKTVDACSAYRFNSYEHRCRKLAPRRMERDSHLTLTVTVVPTARTFLDHRRGLLEPLQHHLLHACLCQRAELLDDLRRCTDNDTAGVELRERLYAQLTLHLHSSCTLPSDPRRPLYTHLEPLTATSKTTVLGGCLFRAVPVFLAARKPAASLLHRIRGRSVLEFPPIQHRSGAYEQEQD